MLNRIALVVAVVCCPPSVAADSRPIKPLPGKWLEVRTPHFVVVSNAGPKQARETAEHFEKIRALFTLPLPQIAGQTGPPLLVFAADGERAMKRLLPAYWESRKRARPAGVFRRSPTATQIAVRADLMQGGDLRVVYHEYFHLLVHNTGPRPPVWIDEGLAEYWGNTHFTADSAEVGRPNATYISILRDSKLLPIDLLVSVDHTSPHYQVPGKKQLLYAQSWALVHWLLLGDESGESRKQFFEYLRLLDGGLKSGEAAAGAFGDLEKLRARLAGYSRNSRFHYVTMRLPESPPAEQFVSRQLSHGEAAARVADFLLEQGRTKDAEGLVDLALKGAPELAVTHRAAGLYHLQRAEYSQAASAFEQAVARDGAGAPSHYGLALLRFHEDRTPAGLEAVEQRLLLAVSVDPGFAPAWARLAEVYRRLDDSPARALVMIRRALAIQPEDGIYRLKAAQILLESGQRDAATAVAGQVVSEAMSAGDAFRSNNLCWYGSFRGLADAVLPLCDHAVEQQPEDPACLDTRGVARAIVGDLAGAISDLRAARELAGDSWSAETRAKRDGWIERLGDDVNPFVGDDLTRLLDDPEVSGLEWGH